MRAIAFILSLFLIGCVADKSTQPIVVAQPTKTQIVAVPLKQKQVIVNKNVYPTAHLYGDYLPVAFEQTLIAQKDILANPNESIVVVHNIRKLNNKAREALKPWNVKDPHPTEAEVERAIIAIASLKVYITVHSEE